MKPAPLNTTPDRRNAFLLAISVVVAVAASAPAADWPMWQYDAQRSAVTPETLPRDMQLQWVLHLPQPKPAWPANQATLQFDASYAPVVHAGKLFVPSMVADHVTAYDLDSGRKFWRFYSDGPVRFAPVAASGRVYFASDDGFLYCLHADDGSLLWKIRGGPDDRRVLGNERLISMWPARGAPVLYGKTIYFASGIWPFMGTFIHAVDAETGKIVWTNSGSGSDYLVQQHNSPAFAGVAPQGYLTATEKHLLVSGGRTVPAVYDRKTGKFIYYKASDRTFGKATGGFGVTAHQGWFFNGGAMFDVADGAPLSLVGNVVASGQGLIQLNKQNLIAAKLPPKVTRSITLDRKGIPSIKIDAKFDVAWIAELKEPLDRIWLQAGSLLYGSREKRVLALQTPQEDGDKASVAWEAQVAGTIWSMLAADKKLLVVTTDGAIHCFGADQGRTEPKHFHLDNDQPPAVSDTRDAAAALWHVSGATGGYTVAYAAAAEADTAANLVEELALRTPSHVILFLSDRDKVLPLRQHFDARGILGTRVAVHHASLGMRLPPYFAELTVCNGPYSVLRTQYSALAGNAGAEKAGGDFLTLIFHSLRPYGGTAAFICSPQDHEQISAAVQAAKLPGAHVSRVAGKYTLLKRTGPLPGAGQWTHQYGDVGNTVMSSETLVRAPMGLLWFGGPSNEKILPRHGTGPTPSVVGGRVVNEGPDV